MLGIFKLGNHSDATLPKVSREPNPFDRIRGKFEDVARQAPAAPEKSETTPVTVATAKHAVATSAAVKRAEVLATAPAPEAAGSEPAAAAHWHNIKAAMKSGLLEKVEIKRYSAKEGETLADIAGRQMGDPRKAAILAKFNGLDAAEPLAEGTNLRIPSGGIINRLHLSDGKA